MVAANVMLAVDPDEDDGVSEETRAKLREAVADGRLANEHFAIDLRDQEVLKEIAGETSEVLLPSYHLEIPVHGNTSDDVFLENIRINAKRPDVPWLHMVPEHKGHAVMVGAGTSIELPSQMEEIAYRRNMGQAIFALNGAAKYLAARHIRPDYLVICDARPENVKFLEGLPAKKYLLCSQCDPSLFDYLIDRGADVMMFHPAHERLSEVIPVGTDVCQVGGMVSVGLMGMSAATALGYRMLHLYGYDSSDGDDGRSHAFHQSENDAEARRFNVVCDGRKFRCSIAMYRQAEVFPQFVGMLSEFGCTITVHGEGLIPTLARTLTTAWPPNAACYDMSKAPASFDFLTWLVVAEMDRRRRGVSDPLLVAFVDGPQDGFRAGDVQNREEKQQILDHVMRPALRLFGASESDVARTGRQFHYWYRPVTDACRLGEAVPRCKVPVESILDATSWLINQGIGAKKALVITLRETRYSPERNSNLDAWIRFARRRRNEGEKIVFVRDTRLAGEPIEGFVTCARAAQDLLFRAALYSLARCNLIVANGPAELLQFSDWPFVELKPISVDPLRPVTMGNSWWQRFAGITPPEAFPWHGKHQLTVWKRDTVENLEEAWSRWKTEND